MKNGKEGAKDTDIKRSQWLNKRCFVCYLKQSIHDVKNRYTFSILMMERRCESLTNMHIVANGEWSKRLFVCGFILIRTNTSCILQLFNFIFTSNVVHLRCIIIVLYFVHGVGKMRR